MAEKKTLSVEERLDALEASNKILTTENEALRKAVIKATESTTKTVELPKIPEKKFKVGDNTYEFVIPHFRIGGEIITALDALNDEKILQDLVDKNSGAIKIVE